MKTLRYNFFIYLLILSGICSVMNAQEVVQELIEDTIISRNVTVEREYSPVIQDAGKANVMPVLPSTNINTITPQYITTYSKPLDIGQNIHFLSAATVEYPRIRYNEGFARLGIGTGFNSLADFAYPLYMDNNTKLDFILNHYGLFNSKAYSNTKADLILSTKNFNLFDFYIGIGGSHEYLKYYGKEYYVLPQNITEVDERDILKNNLWRMNINFGLCNSPWEEGWRYGAHAAYNLFSFGENGITEHQIDIKGNVSTEEFYDSRFGLNITSSNQLYSNNYSYSPDTLKSYYVFSLNPYYLLEKELLDLRLGFKTYFSITKGRGFSIMPDVYVEWRFAPRFSSLYGGVTGDYDINTMSSIAKENIYIQPGVSVDDTYTPFAVFAGIKVKPTNGLLIDAFFNYSRINNQYYFINVETTENLPQSFYIAQVLNKFDVVYNSTNLFKIGGRLSYTYLDKFNLEFKGVYNNWSPSDFDYAWYKPSWEIGFNTSVKIFSSLNIFANAWFEGGRNALINSAVAEMDAIAQINIGADYELFRNMSVFLKINNLINNKYEKWYGYEAQGFNIMAGAVFDF